MAATVSIVANAISVLANVLAFMVTMPIDSLKESIAFTVSSIFATSMAVAAYAGFFPSKKYASNALRVDEPASRMNTRIFEDAPPTSFQSVIWPVKIFATWSFVSALTGLAALTATAVPLAPMGTVSTLPFSASRRSRLMYPRSVSPLIARLTPASEPMSMSPCQVTVGWRFWKPSASALTASSAPPPPFTMYWPASGSGVTGAGPTGNAPPQLAATRAPARSKWTVREARIRTLLMDRNETQVSVLCIDRSIPRSADSRYTLGSACGNPNGVGPRGVRRNSPIWRDTRGGEW